MPFSLHQGESPSEMSRRIAGCRERLRRRRSAQKIEGRATETDAATNAPEEEAGSDESPTPDAHASGDGAQAESASRVPSLLDEGSLMEAESDGLQLVEHGAEKEA